MRKARCAIFPATSSDIDGAALSPESLKKLAALDPSSLPKVDGSPRIGPCVARPLNFVCIGLNYADHAAETGAAIPKEPIVFLKSLGAFQGPNDDVKIPRGSKKTDWEVELGIVIGTQGELRARARRDGPRRRLLHRQRRERA